MKKYYNWQSFVLVLVIFIVGYFFGGLNLFSSKDIESQNAPVVPRVTQNSNKIRKLEPSILLNWIREENPYAIIDNQIDALPNGLSLEMAPFVVNWKRSKLDEAEDGYYLVHNVNIGGDPIKKTTVLATIKIPENAIESVEFLFVRDRKNGKDALLGHGQLRFIFKFEKRPVILLPLDKNFVGDPYIDDLIISYEAWRPPGAPYQTLKGFDPDQYALTVRCYSGSYNFLLAALRNRTWEAYPLNLPPVEDAKEELFKLSLMFGDALSRRVMFEMFRDGDIDQNELAKMTEQDIEKATELFSQSQVPSDPVQELLGKAKLSYHLLLRSCMTISMFNIDLAIQRLYEKHDLGKRDRIKLTPQNIPQWVDRLPDAGKTELLILMPGMVLWIATNQNVLPANAYKLLEIAGVLQEQNGKPIMHKYIPETNTPYSK